MYDGEAGIPSTNYARIENRIAYLSGNPFARSLCQSVFGIDNYILEGLVGRYTRGKRKGLLRGAVIYDYCVHGGWVSHQGLQRRGMIWRSIRLVDAWTRETILDQ